MKTKLTTILLLALLGGAKADIPFEAMVGKKKSSVDLMFFKFLKKEDGANSKFLFFNRNRVSISNDMLKGGQQPIFSFTEALSYNHPNLKGFAPVVVGQVLSWAVLPKAGVQFVHAKNRFYFFSVGW